MPGFVPDASEFRSAIALACFVGTAIMWIIPDRRIDRMVSHRQETPD